MAKPEQASQEPWYHLSLEKKELRQLAKGAAILLLTTKVALPLLGKIGGLVFRRGNKQQEKKKLVATAPPGEGVPSQDVWAPIGAPPAPIPDDLKEIYTTTLACSTKQFYEWFLSGNSDFHKQLHMQLEKRDDFFYGPWVPAPAGEAPPGSPANPADNSYLAASGRNPYDFVLGAGPGSGGFVRNLVFVQPKKGAQNVDADCVQRQYFCVFAGDVIVYATCQNMLNIPFKDCFTVNTCWVVRPAPTGCTLSVHLKVNFVKGCLVGGIIRATTTSSNKEFFKIYGEAAAKAVAQGGPPPKAVVPAARGLPAGAGSSAAPMALKAGPSTSSGLDQRSPMPMDRQLLVAAAMALLLLCLLHQVVLRRDVYQLKDLMLSILDRLRL